MNLTIIFCIEPGYLCPQAVLLAKSIRAWGGRFASARVIAIQPRLSGDIPANVLRALDDADVEVVSADLNREFADSPPTNKVFACAYAEQLCDTELVMFTDTDCVVLNAPEECQLAPQFNLGLQPVVRKFRGTTHMFDRHAALWRRMYAKAKLAPRGFVRTTVTGVPIRPYFNAGLIVFRRGRGFGECWLDMLRRIDDLVEGKARNNLDQFALALAAAHIGGVKIMPKNYNYSIGRRGQYGRRWSTIALNELVHVHYHKHFFAEGFIEGLRPPLDAADPHYDWLLSQLPLPREY